MDTLKQLEKAVFDKQPLPDEITDFTLWYEVAILESSPTQCNLAIWFCQSPGTLNDILTAIEKRYPDYYLITLLPYALAKSVVEEWSVMACNLIVKMAERRVPLHGVIEALITMPREAFVGRFDPRAQMLPARQPYQLR